MHQNNAHFLMLYFCSDFIYSPLSLPFPLKTNALIYLHFNFAINLRLFFVRLEPRGLAQDIRKQLTGLSTDSVGKRREPLPLLVLACC